VEVVKERILLTPEMAQEFLAINNPKNRKIRQTKVNSIAQDILAGRWDERLAYIQDPLMIDTDGVFQNGQHRCLAVIKAGRPVWTYIERNVPPEIFELLDGGTARIAADFLDVPNKNNVAALAKIICAVEDGDAPLASALLGKLDAKTLTTRTQVIEKVNSDAEYIQQFVRAGQRIGLYLFNKKTYAATALFLIDYVGRGDVMERFVFEASQMSTSSQPINAMRTYVSKCMANKNYKTDSKWLISCILYTYEAFRSDTEVHQFNKLNNIFSKYDKYVFEKRKAIREGE